MREVRKVRRVPAADHSAQRSPPESRLVHVQGGDSEECPRRGSGDPIRHGLAGIRLLPRHMSERGRGPVDPVQIPAVAIFKMVAGEEGHAGLILHLKARPDRTCRVVDIFAGRSGSIGLEAQAIVEAPHRFNNVFTEKEAGGSRSPPGGKHAHAARALVVTGGTPPLFVNGANGHAVLLRAIPQRLLHLVQQPGG